MLVKKIGFLLCVLIVFSLLFGCKKDEKIRLQTEAKAAEKGGTTTIAEAQSVTAPGTQESILAVCDRTPQIRDAILKKVRTEECSIVTIEDLKIIVNLDLKSKGIKELKPGDFSGLSSLSWLSLGDNKIRNLHPNQFADLVSLKWFYLYDNEIQSLSPNQFASLTVLEDLYIYGNQIKSLSPNQFAGLTALRILYLHDNKIRNLSPNQFVDLTNLHTLWLSGNNLSGGLPTGVFSPLVSLKELFLTYMNLTEVEKDRIKKKLEGREELSIHF